MARAYRLKNDRFRRQRGGKARLLLISCARCGGALFVYQKDGVGGLKRCYHDRVVAMTDSNGTPIRQDKRNTTWRGPVTCGRCGLLVGTPMVHWSGRPAFRLRLGSFSKKAMNA